MKVKLLKRLRKQITIFHYPNRHYQYVLVKKPTIIEHVKNFWLGDRYNNVPYPKKEINFLTLLEALDWIKKYVQDEYWEFSREVAEIRKTNKILTKLQGVNKKVWYK